MADGPEDQKVTLKRQLIVIGVAIVIVVAGLYTLLPGPAPYHPDVTRSAVDLFRFD